jgi:hypothetical protein
VDTVQIILLVVVVVITTLLVSLGVQIFFLIKEIRLGVQKVHGLLDKVSLFGDHLTSPFTAFSTLFKETSLITVIKVVKTLLSHDKKTHDK